MLAVKKNTAHLIAKRQKTHRVWFADVHSVPVVASGGQCGGYETKLIAAAFPFEGKQKTSSFSLQVFLKASLLTFDPAVSPPMPPR